MSDKTTKTVETDKGLAGTKQKETTQTERDSNPDPSNPNPDQRGGTASENPNQSDFGSGGGRVSG
jgi:hypothetical protein